MRIEIHQLQLLRDNYCYILRDTETGKVAIVDPSDAEPVIAYLEAHHLNPHFILNTHHHWDHTDGNVQLKLKYDCKLVAPKYDQHRIANVDVGLQEGDEFSFGNATANILHIPGHTLGHIAFYFKAEGLLFCGDTLFSLGCGRLFEGSPKQMWSSLSRLASLPAMTKVYCGHEYTLANAQFAISIEPNNEALRRRLKAVQELRGQGLPTVPSILEDELSCNPFLRPSSPEIRAKLDCADGVSDVEVFAQLRKLKDNF